MKTSRDSALTPLCAAARRRPGTGHQRLLRARLRHQGQGHGRRATALAQDSLGGANNPASMVWVGNRLDLGADVFMPKRDAERSGARIPADQRQHRQRQDRLPGPRVRLQPHDEQRHVGRRVGLRQRRHEHHLPAGQLPTAGRPGPANILCGSGELGVDLMQLIVAPTVAYKLNAQHAVGVSLLLGYQRFKATGLQAFDNTPGFPPSPATGQRHQQRLRQLHRRRPAPGLPGPPQRHADDRRGLCAEDEHGQVRQVQGPVRRERRLRHPVALQHRRGLHADAGRDRRVRLRAHQLQRRQVGQQPEPAAAGPAGRAPTAPASAGRTSTSSSSAWPGACPTH